MDGKLELALKGGMFKRLIEQQFYEIRQKYDLKKVDIEVLYFLAKNQAEDTPTAIYQCLKLNRGHVSQAIDALYRKGLILAMPDKTDRRHMHYKISETADVIIEDMERIHRILDQQVFKGLTEDEIRQYKMTTEKILKNIENICESKAPQRAMEDQIYKSKRSTV